jgi:hypothetical protein
MSDGKSQTLLEQVNASTTEPGDDYRELLLRNESPRPGDMERLIQLMGVLGRRRADLPGDLALARELAAAEAQAADFDAAQAELKALAGMPHGDQKSGAAARFQAAERAVVDRDRLRLRWAAIGDAGRGTVAPAPGSA